jgi:hypothetical protein
VSPQARRLLALAVIYDGGTCSEAAKLAGVGFQIDWVLRFNARGPDRLLNGKSPGQPSKLSDAQRQAVARIESGPIPAVHGVVRWRLVRPTTSRIRMMGRASDETANFMIHNVRSSNSSIAPSVRPSSEKRRARYAHNPKYEQRHIKMILISAGEWQRGKIGRHFDLLMLPLERERYFATVLRGFNSRR